MAKELGDLIHQYERNRYAFSDFLGLAEKSEILQELREYPGLPWTLYGGYPDGERVMLRIGSEETLGYEEPFPIRAVRIAPKNQKFADILTHRDFLGAILNTGIRRDTVGDICLVDNVGFVFCTEAIAPYLVEQLERVKHTKVCCEIVEELPEFPAVVPEEWKIQVSSLRLDQVISHTWNLSRGEAQKLFPEHRVFVDGILCENCSHPLKMGELVSVRGYGRLALHELRGKTRKGKQNVVVRVTKR